MGSPFTCNSLPDTNSIASWSSSSWYILLLISILPFLTLTSAETSHCRTSCGDIPINYPFGIDDGCGSPYYRHILVCSGLGHLELRTPSGRYPIRSISYSDPHILVTDPFMWNCLDGNNFRPTRPFSVDTSTHFSLSSQNDYLFFNCSEDQYCASYTSVFWRNVDANPPGDQVPEYGIRVDFEIPVTTRCLQCQDTAKGGGTCGFDTETQNFLCLCKEGNVTTYCKDPNFSPHGKRIGVIVGTASTVSVAGAIGIGAGIWYLRKVRAKAPVTHGVVSNENRVF
ncbi:hypothetical protein F0562_014380 [Nyssa sinensis]|uniref:non-specific serine/threonine protein kinase n=1 Tax=Nyssa sinensis TaxID=561372 RepID=A0A5J4ZQH7_9ASTE|nr:hypothetical protein F0562_014380 [Nyssa sinensis]